MSLGMPAGSPGTIRSSTPFELRHASTHRPVLVVVPERRLLVIHGAGPRDAADFRLATAVLRTVGEIVRAMVVRAVHAEPVRSVLEIGWPLPAGLTVDGVLESLSSRTPRWRQMIEVPQLATGSMATDAIEEARRRAGRAIPLVRLAHVTEGPAVQILHVGTNDQASSIRKLYAFVAESGLAASGDLHELVVADPNVVGEARARSILRVPVEDATTP